MSTTNLQSKDSRPNVSESESAEKGSIWEQMGNRVMPANESEPCDLATVALMRVSLNSKSQVIAAMH